MGCKQSKEKDEEEPKQEQQEGGEETKGEDGGAEPAATDEAGETGGDGQTATDQQADQDPDKTEDGAKIIVVFGATGNQGGSVVKAMQKNDKYKIRAVTRNPDSDKAKAMAESDVEVVKADFDDAESLKTALEGAYGVFLITVFWEHMDTEKEIAQGRAAVDACKAAAVRHLIYSGEENVKEATGKSCKPFDTKAAVEEYIKEQDIPHTFVHYPLYYEDFLTTLVPKLNDDGDLALGIPMGDNPLPTICVEESGQCIHELFNNLEEYQGQTVGLASDKLKVEEYAAILSKAVDGKTFVAGTVTVDQMAEMEFPGAAEMASMFGFLQTDPPRDVDVTRRLNPDIVSFEQWAESKKDAFASLE